MTQFTIEIARGLPTNELYEIVWDMYKDVNGIRPRHMAPTDREAFLTFLEYELRPETMARRQREWAAEAEQLAEQEAEWLREDQARQRLAAEEEAVRQELAAAYDDRYDYIEMRV